LKSTHSPRPEKTGKSKSKIGAVPIIFFDAEGVVMAEYVPPGETTNQKYYVECVLKCKQKFKERDWSSGRMVGFFSRTAP
jgi:hypothetical protein